MSKSKKLLIGIIVIGLAFGAGYFSKPESVKEVIKYKEAKDVVIVKTKYVYADGSTKEQEIIKDKTNTSVDSEKVVSKKGLGARVNLSKRLDEQNLYALHLDSPPLLTIFKTQIGLSAGLESDKNNLNPSLGLYLQF